MNNLLYYLKQNIIFIFLAFSLVSEAIVVLPFKYFIYCLGLIYLVIFSLYNNSQNNKYGNLYILFLIVCFLSSCMAVVFDYRIFAFAVIIISCTPITNSFRLYSFRRKYLYHCLMIFPILMVLSLICYFFDINYYVSGKTTGMKGLDFSAFFPHPMWLGFVCGMSNIVIIWLLFFTQKIYLKVSYSILLLLSIYLSIIAASRAAFFASIFSIAIFIIVWLHNIKKIILAICIVTVITIMFFPIYLVSSKRMQNKFENSEGKYGSRTELFVSGFNHFEEQPLLGQGFAVSHNSDGEKFIGRMESGSGWLSILLQIGIIGLLVIWAILFQLRKLLPFIFKDKSLLLYLFSFLYLCLHSGFEGYLLTVGYYPCILFWTLLGFLHVYPYYEDNKCKLLYFYKMKS